MSLDLLLAVSLVLLLVLPRRAALAYAFVVITPGLIGAFFLLFAELSGDETLENALLAVLTPTLGVLGVYVVRLLIEEHYDRYIHAVLLSGIVSMVVGMFRFFSPVAGVDPGDGRAGRGQHGNGGQPHQPPQQRPGQEPRGQQQGQAPDNHPIVPDPEQVDPETRQGDRTIEEMVREADQLADEIDEYRQ